MRQVLSSLLGFAALLLADILFLDTHAQAAPPDIQTQETLKSGTKITYGHAPQQYGTLWLPNGDGPFAVVIIVHGGCWVMPNMQPELEAISQDLSQSGLAVWNIEYQPIGSTGVGYPGVFNDISGAVDYVRTLAKSYPLDLKHVLIMGHSAGGHLALWAAARHKLPVDSPLYRPHPLTLTAAISLAGIPDLQSFRDHGRGCGQPDNINELVGKDSRPGQDIFSDTSPIAMLPLGTQQIIISGDKDSIVPTSFAANYVKAAQLAGDKVELIHLPQSRHMDMVMLGTTAWQQIKERLLALLKSNDVWQAPSGAHLKQSR